MKTKNLNSKNTFDQFPTQDPCGSDQHTADPAAADSDSAHPSYQPLAQEVAVAISYNGLSHTVMMATPEALDDFALGFSLTSGVISQPEQILDLVIAYKNDGILLDVTLNQRALSQLKQQRRVLTGTSGCGLCGVEALSQALSPIPNPSQGTFNFHALPTNAHLSDLRQRFQTVQNHRQVSGAMHCAIFVSGEGETLLCREDIGRHNALDKLIGACTRSGQTMRAGFIAITSRCSLELIQKSVRAGAGTLISLSSPSDISVRWAREYKLNLLHQPAEGPARIYSAASLCQTASMNSHPVYLHAIQD